MHSQKATHRRRLIGVLSVAGAVGLCALATRGIFEPTYQRFLGVNIADGLAGAAYLSVTTVGLASAGLLRIVVRRKERLLTVRELRGDRTRP